jgi:hypothetical protein
MLNPAEVVIMTDPRVVYFVISVIRAVRIQLCNNDTMLNFETVHVPFGYHAYYMHSSSLASPLFLHAVFPRCPVRVAPVQGLPFWSNYANRQT